MPVMWAAGSLLSAPASHRPRTASITMPERMVRFLRSVRRESTAAGAPPIPYWIAAPSRTRDAAWSAMTPASAVSGAPPPVMMRLSISMTTSASAIGSLTLRGGIGISGLIRAMRRLARGQTRPAKSEAMPLEAMPFASGGARWKKATSICARVARCSAISE